VLDKREVRERSGYSNTHLMLYELGAQLTDVCHVNLEAEVNICLDALPPPLPCSHIGSVITFCPSWPAYYT
jgi:hypothetical protein